MPGKRTYTALVLDIDNTLFDWLDMWRTAFGAALDVLSDQSTHSEEILLDRIRALHQLARTSERGFAEQDAEFLSVSSEAARGAGEAFEATCLSRTRAYPGVLETLQKLRRAGVRIVLHTDTPVVLAVHRVAALQLAPFIDGAFATDHEAIVYRARPSLGGATIRRLEHPKPSPAALETILFELGSRPEQTVYLGDSKTHDIPMARAVGVLAVFAEYGCRRTSADYDLLRRVSHWNDSEIAQERERMKSEADHSLASFADIVSFFR